jgi:hypothetical protein
MLLAALGFTWIYIIFGLWPERDKARAELFAQLHRNMMQNFADAEHSLKRAETAIKVIEERDADERADE